MSGNKEQKRLQNRFDEYEICHTFTESTQEFLEKQKKPVHGKFVLKCILGTLLAVNAYLSHWGPWKWPSNYYIILFSVIFYYAASTFYSHLNPVDNTVGNPVIFQVIKIGQYEYKGKKRIFTMIIGDSKTEYTLEILDSQSKESLATKTFIYYEYFTERGIFLEELYHKNLTGFLQTFSK